MSDLFRSALGYLSSASSGSVGGVQGGQGGQGHHGGYTTASGGPSDETAAIGEVITFSHNTEQKRNVKIVKLIAEGGFSFVFRAVDIQNGDSVAVKKILAPDAEALKSVEHEIEFMRQFQHEHIVKFYGSFMKNTGKNLQEHFIGMEYCPVPLPTPPFRLIHTTQTYAQTCKAIKYLHDFGIVHRDIKLENLLIGADGLVKLVDFGSATMEKIYPTADWSMAKRTLVEEQIAAKTTPMYRAPEMLDLWSNHPIDEHADLWALGCLLFALNFGQHPFQDSNKLAIVNANYSLPKNVSSSGPIVSLIKGLLQVNPADRFSFGQMFEILASISESEGFSLNGQLPFKPASSPNITGGGGPGIVNPLGSAAAHPQLPGSIPTQLPQHSQQQHGGGSSGSLFSSLKGGAVSLLKNIKEQSQQYLAPPGPGGPPPEAGEGLSRPVPPSRPASGPSTLPPTSRPLPPRPAPPSPMTQRREAAAAAAASHIEFENREYEAMQQKQHGRPQRPTPPKPPPPKFHDESQPQRVANLLDIGSEDGQRQRASNDSSNTATNQPSSTADLLGDLFSSSSSAGIGNNFGPSSQTGSVGTEDLFWGNGTPSTASNIGSGSNFTNGSFMNNGGMNLQSSNNQVKQTITNEISGDLLGDTTDPFASLLGKSLPNSMTSTQSSQQNQLDGFANFGSSQPFLQPLNPSTMPSSSSFQNLNTNSKDSSGGFGGGGLLDTGSSRIPKNSSSPNLLSDLILDDIMGLGNLGINNTNVGGSGSSVNKSNPSLNQSIPPNLPNSSGNNRPNYNRNQIFDPPAGAQSDKKQTLDDVFGDILSSQGFGPGKADGAGKTINAMRKIEMLSNPNMDPTQIKVNDWREGKKKNIRALLSSLHTVTWDGCNWEETNMSQMITPAQVKKTYRKACLAIHPDKQMGQDWEDLAKLIFVELNEAWGAFEEAQQ